MPTYLINIIFTRYNKVYKMRKTYLYENISFKNLNQPRVSKVYVILGRKFRTKFRSRNLTLNCFAFRNLPPALSKRDYGYYGYHANIYSPFVEQCINYPLPVPFVQLY